MTVLVGTLSIFLAAVLALVGVRAADASAARARAQLAADSAALAAVAESAPYGGGDPEIAATEYARMNGARLVSCICPRGATAMQVEVAVGDVTARARAVIEPELFRPQGELFAAAGMHPVLRASVEKLIAHSGGAVSVTSGYRSLREQQMLWTSALQRYGSAEAADDWVAPPGHSMHEKGLAVDLGGDLALAARLVEELGLPLHRPLPHEPHHFELVGSRS
ncbi:MAG: D-alanyl-D-alanine carboxypeptidase family protein [Actinobacteria bacterium]|nr:D-alanyl-D-alanine carboxypeptidase family protein [Actinomycetota bacterium]